MVKKKKEIKIVRGSDTNYTFLEIGISDIKKDLDDINEDNTSDVDKDLLKTRLLDSKKSKVRNKNRITGGQIKQSHSSVYE